MFRRTCLSLAFLLISLPLFADAAANYKSKCAPCHGPDGTGNTPVGKSLHVKSLADPDVQKMKDDDLFKVLRDGKNKMPPFKDKLSDDDLKQLVQFIRTFAPHK